MNVFHLKPNYLHLLNIPCFYKSLPLYVLFGMPVPPHPTLHPSTFYPANSYLHFKTKIKCHFLFSTFPDSLEANLSELTQNFVHTPIIMLMSLSCNYWNVCSYVNFSLFTVSACRAMTDVYIPQPVVALCWHTSGT